MHYRVCAGGECWVTDVDRSEHRNPWPSTLVLLDDHGYRRRGCRWIGLVDDPC